MEAEALDPMADSVALGNPGVGPDAPELIKAGESISPDAPAYVTAQFHVARLLIAQGKDDEARTRLDAMLAKGATMPHSAVNQLSALRLKVARNFDEFLRYAPRYPVESAGDTTTMLDDDSTAPQPLLDIDSAEPIDRWLPLSVLKEAPRSESLPRSLRANIAPSIWLRTVLLGDETTARGLAPIVGELVPDLKPSLEAWSAAKTREEHQFALVMMVLRNPGMRPYVAPGLGRPTPLGNTDEFRDNWWPSYDAVALAPLQPGPCRHQRRRSCRNTQFSSLQRRGNLQNVNGIACGRSTGRSSFVALRSSMRVSARKTNACPRRFIDVFPPYI
jgi:hypothetical protein